MEQRSFFVDSFEEFHQILFEYRKQILESTLFLNVESIEDKNRIIADIQRKIIVFIRDKTSQVFKKSGLIGEKVFTEIGYIMASLADEIFLSLQWEGKQYWQNNLIERKIFNTANSGESIFNRIDMILKDNSADAQELSLIYFYTLALGFKGAWKYLAECNIKINELKSKLYYKIYYKDSTFFKEKLNLFPEAYKSILNDSKEIKTSSFMIWQLITVGLIAIYIICIELIWNYKIIYLLDILTEFIGGGK